MTLLLVSLIPSGIGFVLFRYGKKQQRWPQLYAGIFLMVYPYFAPTMFSMVAVGGAIGLALWCSLQLGW